MIRPQTRRPESDFQRGKDDARGTEWDGFQREAPSPFFVRRAEGEPVGSVGTPDDGAGVSVPLPGRRFDLREIPGQSRRRRFIPPHRRGTDDACGGQRRDGETP